MHSLLSVIELRTESNVLVVVPGPGGVGGELDLLAEAEGFGEGGVALATELGGVGLGSGLRCLGAGAGGEYCFNGFLQTRTMTPGRSSSAAWAGLEVWKR